MSTLYRRKSRRRSSNHFWLPILTIATLVVAACLGLYFLYENKIKVLLEGQPPIIEYSDVEANANLTKLLGELSGSKSQLLELQDEWRAQLGWIKDDKTRKQFLWILMSRLMDKGEWERALRILPEVEHLASIEQINRLAVLAQQNNDLELQMRLDQRLQDLAMQNSTKVDLLLRSIQRTTETAIRLKRTDDALKALARLEVPAIQARLTRPEDAALAAYLLMQQAEISAVKEPILQKVRNILEAARWPDSPVTAQLIVQEASNAMRDNPAMDEARMRDILEKLSVSRDSMLGAKSEARFLPECYFMMGDLSYRLGDYEAAASALDMALAFAKGYQKLSPEQHIAIIRLQFLVNDARGAVEEALLACRYLLEHDTDEQQKLRYLMFLAGKTEGEEKNKHLLTTWDILAEDAALAESNRAYRVRIARELSDYFKAQEKYSDAITWYKALLQLTQETHTELLDGLLFEMRIELALMQRKQELDTTARNGLQAIVSEIESLDEESRDTLDKNKPNLYKTAVRELSRTYLLMGDSTTSRKLSRTIREGLPSKKR